MWKCVKWCVNGMDSVSDIYVYIYALIYEMYASDMNNVYNMNLHDEEY